LIAYHFGQATIVSAAAIPLLYAVAMATDGAAALILGALFDRYGAVVMVASMAVGAIAAPLVFLGGAAAAFAGMILWGIGVGAQDPLIRAAVTRIVAPDRRATAFGVLNAVFGISWFVGSSVLGILYDRSVVAVVVVSAGLQLLALPVLFAATARGRRR